MKIKIIANKTIKYVFTYTGLVVISCSLFLNSFAMTGEGDGAPGSQGEGKGKDKETEDIHLANDTQDSQKNNDTPGDGKEGGNKFENSSLEVDQWTNGLPKELWWNILSSKNLSYGNRRNVQVVSTKVRDLVRETWTQEEIDLCINCFGRNPWELTEITQYCTGNKYLHLDTDHPEAIWSLAVDKGTPDETLSTLGQFPNLFVLSLNGCTRLTGIGITAMVKSCPKSYKYRSKWMYSAHG